VHRSPRGRKVARTGSEASVDLGASTVVRRRGLVRRQSSQSPGKPNCPAASPSRAAKEAEKAVKPVPLSLNSVTKGSTVALLFGDAFKDNIKAREWLQSQLETIRKQSEDILKKDLQLKELQRENERLRQRLKQLEDSQTYLPVTTSSPPPLCTTPPAATAVLSETSSSTTAAAGSKKRPAHLIAPRVQKWSKVDKAVCTDISNVTFKLKVIQRQKKSKSEEGNSTSEEPPKKRKKVLEGKVKAPKVIKEKKSKTENEFELKPLMTSEPYLILTSLDVIAEEKAEAASIAASSSQVPSWRLMKSLGPPVHSMEGTECLEKAVMTARHDKLEVAEKKRKRWDIMRIRELRHVAALKERQERGRRPAWAAQSPASPLSTLLPDPFSDATHLEVSDTLPVTAFGLDTSALAKTPFKLPWHS